MNVEVDERVTFGVVPGYLPVVQDGHDQVYGPSGIFEPAGDRVEQSPAFFANLRYSTGGVQRSRRCTKNSVGFGNGIAAHAKTFLATAALGA